MDKSNITGNKGEWSEIYVLLKLLAEGRVYAADEELNKLQNMYFPIIKIIREEIKGKTYEYTIDTDNGKINVCYDNKVKRVVKQKDIEKEVQYLLSELQMPQRGSFSVGRIEKFMLDMECKKLAAPSSTKSDIIMQIYDIHTGYSPICGFSIKSEIGNAPTLINASKATNFIYEVKGLTEDQIKSINAIDSKTKIKDRMNRIFTEAEEVKFSKVNSQVFTRNLMLIDSRMEELVAQSLIYNYRDGLINCADVIDRMEVENPMNYPNEGFYSYKYKKMLCSVALGMTPAKNWDGIDEANGGYIVVGKDGGVLAYHIYNRTSFEYYLLANTKFERPSTSRHEYAVLYKEDGKIYLNLNLQIRFK